MPRSPTGRYCESPPRSPRRYDKYTYSSKRRPEGPEEGPYATPTRSAQGRFGSAYEACVAGVAPLMNNLDGFAVAEDGTVQSRFVSAPRYSAPSIAMVPVPMAVIPVARDGNAQYATPVRGGEQSSGYGDAFSPAPMNAPPASPSTQARVLMSPPNKSGYGEIAPIPYTMGVSEVVPSSEVEAWKRLVMVAGRDFKEDELANLSWETLTELLAHYKIGNPLDIARIQLAWKRRQGLLPSDTAAAAAMSGDPIAVLDQSGQTYVAIPKSVRYPNAPSPGREYGSSAARASSPRRDSPRRYVPGYKQHTVYDHVSPKVDTGRRSRTPNRAGTPTRTGTPTRPSQSKPFRY